MNKVNKMTVAKPTRHQDILFDGYNRNPCEKFEMNLIKQSEILEKIQTTYNQKLIRFDIKMEVSHD